MRFLALPLLVVATALAACAQPARPAGEIPAERAERILANLRFEFPQLEDLRLEVTELGPSAVPGLDQGVFVINGQQPQPFLVTADDRQLWLLATDPIDASRTPEQLAAAQREREEAAVASARERARELNETFADLPVRGNPDAPVTIVEFSDFQCPFCARAHETLKQLLANNPRDVRLIYVQYPLPHHAWARPASIAALCAAQQSGEAFWALHDAYFEQQRTMTPANLLERSRAALQGTGIDLAAWSTCVEDTSSPAHQRAAAELEGHRAVAEELGVTGTPAFFINGRFLNGAQPLEVFQSVVDAAKADAR